MVEFVHTERWGKVISRFLKSEMAAKGLKYRNLSDKLADIGTHQSEGNLRQKVNRGQLSAQLFIQLLIVMEIETLETEQIKKIMIHLANSSD